MPEQLVLDTIAALDAARVTRLVGLAAPLLGVASLHDVDSGDPPEWRSVEVISLEEPDEDPTAGCGPAQISFKRIDKRSVTHFEDS